MCTSQVGDLTQVELSYTDMILIHH